MSEAMVTMNIRIEESQRDEIDREMEEANEMVASVIRSSGVCVGSDPAVAGASIWQNRSQFLRWVIDVGLEEIRHKNAASGLLADRSDV